VANFKPTEKMQAVGTAGAATVLLLYLLDPQGQLPPAVAAAITLLIGWAAGWIKREGAGWLRLLRRKRGDHAAS